jgi:D-glycero-D-manno-heptose 1,7-bisphosphate phosphatase
VPGIVNGGVYWVKRSILDRVTFAVCSLETDILPPLVAEGRVAAKLYGGYFIDIGTPRDFERADQELRRAFTAPAVFFDRDNTLIEDRGYTHKVEDLRWFAGVPAMIKRLNDANVLVFVVTNQAGVAKGHYDEEAVITFHRYLMEDLRAVGAHIDDWRYCPHHEDGTVAAYVRACSCRKPQPGMLKDILKVWPVDTAASLMLGNSDSDVAAGEAAGLAATRVVPGQIVAAVDTFLGRLKQTS